MDCRVGKYKKRKITAHFCLLNFVMINEHFERIVKEKFGFDFSPTQQAAMKNFLAFLFDRHPESLFLLKWICRNGENFFGGGHREYITAI